MAGSKPVEEFVVLFWWGLLLGIIVLLKDPRDVLVRFGNGRLEKTNRWDS
jgi:hypothetical protein